ncbi:MAG: AhpC/TSA family protein [Bacteroidetes bacterium]|nr:AhpC/TSA family protein [Bacteroidota bacterium]MBT4399285.1 AhpC/TSA family protein [Bacteroidota bacterium]MBT5427735.1 AhpC/TSA family protein [Bacteroidota bacterium]MBT7094130.1 AhpC/TSA family protein [Bacteroidota bacterium]
MQKVWINVVLSLVILFSLNCTGEKSFTISGKISGAENDSILIQEMQERGLKDLATVQVDKSGNIYYTDTAQNPRFLFLKTKNNEYLSLLVLNGQDIKLNVDLSDINGSIDISGSPESILIWELNKEMQSAAKYLDSLGQIYEHQKEIGSDSEADSWLQGKYSELLADQRDYILNFLNENHQSPACLMALSHQINGQTVLNPQRDFVYFAKVDSSLSEQYPESLMVTTLHNWVVSYRQEQSLRSAQNQSIGIGVESPEIKLPNPDGAIISLSSLRGKYVLLDFWAAWCSPCRRENPNLVRAYNKFNSKGFEIYQVSLDRKRADWVQAIQADKLNWTQVSDLKYWGSPVAKLYYISSIPANFLIDPEGKIIATNLRGVLLDQKLSEIFN